MPTFGAYLRLTALVALALSTACLLFNPILSTLLSHHVLGFVPKSLALALGTVHSPSYLGLFVGLFLEWVVLGLLVSVVLWMLKTRGRGEGAT
jgi:hypothetical protein